jgi:shikimate dehydrogenase
VAKFPTPPKGKTLAAVIGHPVEHSLSPTIYNAAFSFDKIDWVYVAVEVLKGDVKLLLDEMRALPVGGLSVTMPHKETVANLLDRCTHQVKKLGVVNCVYRDEGTLVGHNTDGEGFLRSLKEETKEDVTGKTYLIIGAGGAARAVSLALGESGAKEVIVTNRDETKASSVASLAGLAGRVGKISEAHFADVIINATPLGMGGTGNDEQLPLPIANIQKEHIVVDLIYNPLETPLLTSARQMGARTVNGIGMLVHQAALQYSLWTGKEAPLDVMFDAVTKKISR